MRHLFSKNRPLSRTRTRWGQALALALGSGLLLGGPAAHAQTTPQVSTFSFTGGNQTYTVPAGVTTIQVDATAGSGASSTDIGGGPASFGARVAATLTVVPGEVLTVVVGGQGQTPNKGGKGGFNGGGAGPGASAGGGGATDLRRASAGTGDYLTTRNALLVAGGAGGGYSSSGGSGGTPTGADGTRGTVVANSGATQTQAGVPNSMGNPGVNGTGGDGSTSGRGSGGGGGYYGGAGLYFGSGGGGSSWVMPGGSSAISYGLASSAPNDGSLVITAQVLVLPMLTAIDPTSGPTGTSVMLTGSNLSGATAVTFSGSSNNTVTTGLTVSGTGTSQTLTVIVPSGAATGPVTVTVPNGTGGGVSFTVTAPQLALSQDGTGYPNGGAAYAFAAQTVGTTSAPVAFTLLNAGSAPLSIMGISATGDFALSGPAPTTVAAGSTASVSVTFAPTATGPRTGTLVISSSLGTYTVNLSGPGQNPTLTTGTLAAGAYCAGSALSVPFTATVGFAADNVFTAQLSSASGSFATPTVIGTLAGATSGSIAATLPATATGTGYRIRVVGSSPAVTGPDNGADLTITAPQTAGFGYGAVSSFCTSQTTAQAVELASGATAGTFSSTPGLTIDATTGAITPSTSTPGTYTVTNAVATSGGCAAATATSPVTITAPQTAGFGFPATAVCAGAATTLTPTLTPGATAGTFSLPPATGLTIDPTTGAVTVEATAAAGTYTVTNTVAASGGCAASTSTASFTLTAPTTATFAYASSPFCQSSQALVTPTLTGTAGGTFSSTTGLTLNATTGAITPATSAAGTYVVTYTVAGPCGSSATQSVTITAPQTAGFGFPATTVCAGAATTLTPTLTPGATAGTFSLPPATGLTIDPTTGAVTVEATAAAGTYTVTNTVAASGGCAASTSTASFVVSPVPATPVLTASGTSATGITLTSSAATGNQFYLNGVLIAGATGQTYLVNSSTGNGAYTVVTTGPGGCASAASVAVNVTITITATAQAQAGREMRLYPNPTHDGKLTLELHGYGPAPVELTVLNALGQRVYQGTAKGPAAQVLYLSELPTGMYLLQVRTADGQRETRRFMRN